MKYESAAFEASFGTANQLPVSDLPEIAFSGRSNVGKSTLLNKLLNRKSLARVSSVPGKTITINFFKLNECRFVDLPGYGYAKVSAKEKSRWAELMEAYFSTNRNIRLVIQLIDVRHNPTKDDLQMLEFLRFNSIPFAVALTKADKLNKTQRTRQEEALRNELRQFGEFEIIVFSSVTGEGVSALKAEIEKSVENR